MHLCACACTRVSLVYCVCCFLLCVFASRVCAWLCVFVIELNLRIQMQRVHSTREDDVVQDVRKAKLERLGVKVNSFLTRAIPLPVFDETQWDHYISHAGRNQVMDLKDRLASDVGLHVLKKAGVAGKRL